MREKNTNKEVAWSALQRLEFIEFRLMWEGRFNRKDLIDAFGISVPQATLDIRAYLERAPENMEYDKRRRFYFPTPAFHPVYISGSADDYLSQLSALSAANHDKKQCTLIGNAPAFDSLPVLERRADAATLQAILKCIREQASIEIHYQSLTTQSDHWRRITPHALASNGMRWHVRAYCHKKLDFRDFVLGRIMCVRDPQPSSIMRDEDTEWHELITVTLIPNPKLTQAQQQIIQRDYVMTDSKKDITLRKSLLYYLTTRLNIEDGVTKSPANQPVVIASILSASQTKTDHR